MGAYRTGLEAAAKRKNSAPAVQHVTNHFNAYAVMLSRKYRRWNRAQTDSIRTRWYYTKRTDLRSSVVLFLHVHNIRSKLRVQDGKTETRLRHARVAQMD
jgi:hypothetical protein